MNPIIFRGVKPTMVRRHRLILSLDWLLRKIREDMVLPADVKIKKISIARDDFNPKIGKVKRFSVYLDSAEFEETESTEPKPKIFLKGH